MESLFDPLCHINWNSLEEVSAATETVLKDVSANKSLFKQMIQDIAHDPVLLERSEHYDILDKLVLYSDDARGFRLRLHVFLPGYFDRPHNHRWTYSSLILRGRYTHFIYGQDHGIDQDINIRELRPVMLREEMEGNFYSLHHSMIHSVVAEPYTLSLVIRGPAVKNRFLVMDKTTNQAWWQYGAIDELTVERDQKKISREYLSIRVAALNELLFT